MIQVDENQEHTSKIRPDPEQLTIKVISQPRFIGRLRAKHPPARPARQIRRTSTSWLVSIEYDREQSVGTNPMDRDVLRQMKAATVVSKTHSLRTEVNTSTWNTGTMASTHSKSSEPKCNERTHPGPTDPFIIHKTSVINEAKTQTLAMSFRKSIHDDLKKDLHGFREKHEQDFRLNSSSGNIEIHFKFNQADKDQDWYSRDRIPTAGQNSIIKLLAPSSRVKKNVDLRAITFFRVLQGFMSELLMVPFESGFRQEVVQAMSQWQVTYRIVVEDARLKAKALDLKPHLTTSEG
ncbi:hypothetical protein GGU10DRAFT_335594 [Lentinula aff. detonsa]|uniref:Uncharacterized protein n=1 Tax=Lentinula aff. detonsa TaxID=2804958 RepID=A0AA38NBY8_9AGAR|nr:hypothetical protein GGU10DRAFT_335594 [Lentinula aff. detonsa]